MAARAEMKWLLGLVALLSVGGARCGCPFSRTNVEYAWAHEAETGTSSGLRNEQNYRDPAGRAL